MNTTAPDATLLPAFLRAFWMVIGNAAVLITGMTIARLAPWTLGWRDVIFWSCVVALVGLRWLDVERYGGTTADGDPMTNGRMIRYAVTVISGATALWILAQSIAF